MRSSLKRGLLAVALALVVAIGFANLLGNHRVDTANEASSSSTSETSSVMRTPIDWQKSSETVAYPDTRTSTPTPTCGSRFPRRNSGFT